MKALCWMGSSKVEVHTVSDPTILNPHDAIIKITRTAICGSDLHLFDGFIPTMEQGDILGHEFMGIVEEVGKDVTNLRARRSRSRALHHRLRQLRVLQEEDLVRLRQHQSECAPDGSGVRIFGLGPFGYSHMMGGYAGGQAQYVRVPFANVGPLKIESDLPDEKVLFLSDIFPTGYMAAENAQIQENDTVAVWGCGPVGQFAIASAFMLGAARVIAIDRLPGTPGDGPFNRRDNGRLFRRRCQRPDCVERSDRRHRSGFLHRRRRPRSSFRATPGNLRQSEDGVDAGNRPAKRPAAGDPGSAQRRHGFDSGVYGGLLDKVPFGAAFGKGITMKMGQTNMHNYMKPLLGAN